MLVLFNIDGKIVCGLLCSTEADALCKISFENLIRISVKSEKIFLM